MYLFKYALLSVIILFSCTSATAPDQNMPSRSLERSKEFDAYWYAGQAEITTYDLEQVRYGELRQGKSILVFVTEEMLLEKQVKKETSTTEASVSVLKLNKIDRFTTGIYDYYMMLSTFTPVDQLTYPYVVKTAFSSQDWCGQSFMQINWKGAGYQTLLHSYFENEGDKSSRLPDVWVEDALWTLARLDPRMLPQSDFEIIPSSANLRMSHLPWIAMMAKGQLTLEMKASGDEQYIYEVCFEDGRELRIFLQTVFPYRIYGWEEKVKQGNEWLKSKAVMDVTTKSSYWRENSHAFDYKRKELGLEKE